MHKVMIALLLYAHFYHNMTKEDIRQMIMDRGVELAREELLKLYPNAGHKNFEQNIKTHFLENIHQFMLFWSMEIFSELLATKKE